MDDAEVTRMARSPAGRAVCLAVEVIGARRFRTRDTAKLTMGQEGAEMWVRVAVNQNRDRWGNAILSFFGTGTDAASALRDLPLTLSAELAEEREAIETERAEAEAAWRRRGAALDGVTRRIEEALR